MLTWAANPCAGLRWRTYPDGTIELEELGRIAVHPGDPRFGNLERTWKNWGAPLRAAARSTGLPAAWLLSFATVETGHLAQNPAAQAAAVSPANAIGVMQILPGSRGPYPNVPTDQLFDPSRNIALGAEFVKKLCSRMPCELPLLGAGYNAGSVRCAPERNALHLFEDHDYSRQLIEFNNAAITYLRTNESVWPWVAGGAAAAAAGAFFWLR